MERSLGVGCRIARGYARAPGLGFMRTSSVQGIFADDGKKRKQFQMTWKGGALWFLGFAGKVGILRDTSIIYNMLKVGTRSRRLQHEYLVDF